MAVRLPVILSQPARRDASATDLVESIVAATLMLPGLDANLIGDIGAVELGSTDHVCLLGHTRDLVLASFLDLSAACAAWQRLQQSGQFIDLAQDEADVRASLRQASAHRKIFYFQLRLGQPAERFLDRCQKLLAAQQLNLVSIQRPAIGGNLPGATGNLPVARAVPVRTAPAVPPATSSTGAAPADRQGQLARSETATVGQAAGERHADDDDDREQWSALDRLVDDLDAMDL